MAKQLVQLNTDGTYSILSYDYDSTRFVPENDRQILISSGLTAQIENVSEIRGDTTITTGYSVFPLAEQKISGTGYGKFYPSELVFQSFFTPQIINYLTLNGVTATEYNPTVDTVGVTGYVGIRAAKFNGSYLDTDTAAAGISLPGFTSASYFLVSGWVYMNTSPTSAYDPIIITHSPDGVSGSTSDSFRLEYDYSSSRFQFHFSTTANTASTGFDHTMNVSPVGVTLNEWNHFAVAYTNAGSSASVSSYWNGNQIQKYTSATGSIRGSKSSVYVGCGGSGKKPFKGWIDDLIISTGTTLEALRGFRHGTTATVPSSHQDAGVYTVYYLSMDGPLGTSYFPCDISNKVCSNVAFAGNNLYIYGSIGVTTSNMWKQTFNGVCGGHAVASSSAGYIFGYTSGACWIPTEVTELSSGITSAKQYRKDLADYTLRDYLGATAMQGASGSSGDFVNLYSGSTFPTSFSYYATEYNLNYLRNVYDAVIVAGSTAPVAVEDAYGNYYSFNTGGVVNLYKDVLNYFNTVNTERTSINTSIDSKSTFTTLKQVKGFTNPKIVAKLAKLGNDSIFISPISTITGTNRSPENNWDISKELQVLPPLDD